jgi:DNA-binding transcriptional MerR regulator
MAEKSFTASFASAFAEISPTTLRAWTGDARFVKEADVALVAGDILAFAPEDQRRPLPQYTWGRYTSEDLLRLHIITRLRADGWCLDDALRVVGKELLSPSHEPPTNYLVLIRVAGKTIRRRFWKKKDFENYILGEGSEYIVQTVLRVEHLRKEVEQKIAQMEDDDA